MVLPLVTQNTRTDLRKPQETRRLAISRSPDATTVSLGDTTVLAHVTASIVQSDARAQLRFSCDVSPCVATPQGTAERLRALLDQSLRRAVDVEPLVLPSSEGAWHLSCHVKVLSYDGNAADAALVAALCALAAHALPAVTVNDGRVQVHSTAEKHPIPLTILHFPVPTSFVFVREEPDTTNESTQQDWIPLIDPTAEEELNATAALTVCVNVHREIVALSTSGACSIPKETLSQCLQIALARAHPLTESIRNAVFKTEKKQ